MNEKKPSSDQLRNATLHEYIAAQSRPSHSEHGNGIKGFLKSNLFSGLVLYFIAQLAVGGGAMMVAYWRVGNLLEWKGQIETRLDRMDNQGTIHGKSADERQDIQLSRHELQINKLEDKTERVPVLESEHRRLTNDVEQLKHEKEK